jgi:hypothetical protein
MSGPTTDALAGGVTSTRTACAKVVAAIPNPSQRNRDPFHHILHFDSRFSAADSLIVPTRSMQTIKKLERSFLLCASQLSCDHETREVGRYSARAQRGEEE